MSTNQPPNQSTGPYPDQGGPGYGQPGQSHPQQGYPQQGYPGSGYPQQPPKKKHTVRNVLLILLALFVLIIGGCMALVGGAINEADKAIKKSQSQDAQPGGPDNPLTIHPGKPFEVSGFKYQPGWTVGTDFGGLAINKLRVTNERDKKDSALVEVKFWKGSEVLASADCSTDPIAPGTTVTVDCISGDNLPKQYDKVTINDTF